MKKLLLITILAIFLLPQVFAVIATGNFPNGKTYATIAEGEKIEFTATAFTLNPNVYGQVYMNRVGDNDFFHQFATFNVADGSFFDQYNITYDIYESCGEFVITVLGYDFGGDQHSAELTLTVECNENPALNLPDEVIIEEDSGLNENVLDLELYASDDGDVSELTYSILSQSKTDIVVCSIDSENNLDCTTKENMYGESDVTFQVKDFFGNTASDTVKVIVSPVNDAPVVSDIPDVSFEEDGFDESIDLDDYVYDVETADEDIQWSFSGFTNIVPIIKPGNVVRFTALENWNGYEDITFTASDGEKSGSDTVRVTVTPVNDGPILTGSMPDVSFPEDWFDGSIDLDDYVYDVETADEDIVWTYSGNTNVYVSIGSTNIITFTALGNWSGSETLTFTATDGAGAGVSDEIFVTVTPVNDAPEVGNIPNVYMYEDTVDRSIDLDNYVTDIDNTPVQISWSFSGNSHIEVSINPVTNVVSLTPDDDWSGSETVTFTATDSGGLSDSDNVRV
ncbi:tandem-95 repeat protein, partial [Bacteroidota bacterium]